MLTLLHSLADTVRALREKQNLSQEALAARSGVHRNYIGILERGQRNPRFESLHLVARGLGMTLSALIAEAESRFLSGSRGADGVTPIRDAAARRARPDRQPDRENVAEWEAAKAKSRSKPKPRKRAPKR
jgi:transcriptional regulator with XRE-family HTH domain